MAKSGNDRRGLGRGLSALMADVNLTGPLDQPASPPITRVAGNSIPIEKLHPNPEQPRRAFGREDLADLAASVREKGIIQPLIVRPDTTVRGDFQIVAGERRWRAAQIAGLHEVPVLVRDFSDIEVIEIAIIENIQRADLNVVEEAQAFRQLMDKFGHTQEKLAASLGKSRSHIANLLRLLTLPPEVLAFVRENKLTMGHARALVSADNPIALAREIIAKGLSVRQAERLAKGSSPKKKTSRSFNTEKDADTRALELDLAANLGMSVAVDHKTGQQSGSVTISYTSLDELDDLCRILTTTSPDVSG